MQPLDGEEEPDGFVRVVEQALRDGIIDRNPARITGWQGEYQQFEDELDDPRSLAVSNWSVRAELADALVARSADRFPGWGHVAADGESLSTFLAPLIPRPVLGSGSCPIWRHKARIGRDRG
jgi:hypothetical protein